MRVTVLFNQPVLSCMHPEADSEQWVATAVDDVARILTAAGIRVSRRGSRPRSNCSEASTGRDPARRRIQSVRRSGRLFRDGN